MNIGAVVFGVDTFGSNCGAVVVPFGTDAGLDGIAGIDIVNLM